MRNYLTLAAPKSHTHTLLTLILTMHATNVKANKTYRLAKSFSQ